MFQFILGISHFISTYNNKNILTHEYLENEKCDNLIYCASFVVNNLNYIKNQNTNCILQQLYYQNKFLINYIKKLNECCIN